MPRALAVLLALAGLLAVAGGAAGQDSPPPTTRHTTRADLVPQAEPLPMELVQVTIDLVPGAASGAHYHSGLSHNTVLAGEVTVRYADGEQRYGVGAGWTDAPGVVHQALNLGAAPATVVVSYVQRTGAPVTVPVASLDAPGPAPAAAPPTPGAG